MRFCWDLRLCCYGDYRFPFLYNIYLSLFRYNLARPWIGMRFVGFQNYIKAVSTPDFLQSLMVTAVFVVAVMAAEFVLGLALALLLNRKVIGERLLRTSILIPLMTAPVVVGLGWKIMLNPDFGFVSHFLSWLGFGRVSLLGDPKFALWAIIAVDVWQFTPFIYLMMLAGLRSIPAEPIEAALIDGASWWDVLVRVQIPMLKPIILVTMIFKSLGAIGVFDTVFVLTQGGPGVATRTLTLYIYQNSFEHLDIGYGSALSVMFSLIIMLVIAGLVLTIREQES